jgi:hypothetical protein
VTSPFSTTTPSSKTNTLIIFMQWPFQWAARKFKEMIASPVTRPGKYECSNNRLYSSVAVSDSRNSNREHEHTALIHGAPIRKGREETIVQNSPNNENLPNHPGQPSQTAARSEEITVVDSPSPLEKLNSEKKTLEKEMWELRTMLHQRDGQIYSLHDLLNNRHAYYCNALQAERAKLADLDRYMSQRLESQEQAQDTIIHASAGAFDNTLDLISESEVVSGGRSSIGLLNSTVNDFVNELLEGLSFPVAQGLPTNAFYKLDHPIVRHFAWASEAGKGFLLDALLHVVINKLLIRVVNGEDPIFDQLLHHIDSNETWSVAQRWRAVTSTGVSLISPQNKISHMVDDYLALIMKVISIAYLPPPITIDSVKTRTHELLQRLCKSGSQLKLDIRSKILSVRLSIIDCPDGTYDPEKLSSVWESDMPVKPGDCILGTYNLGLEKMDEFKSVSLLVRPVAVTDALFRYVEK